MWGDPLRDSETSGRDKIVAGTEMALLLAEETERSEQIQNS